MAGHLLTAYGGGTLSAPAPRPLSPRHVQAAFGGAQSASPNGGKEVAPDGPRDCASPRGEGSPCVSLLAHAPLSSPAPPPPPPRASAHRPPPRAPAVCTALPIVPLRLPLPRAPPWRVGLLIVLLSFLFASSPHPLHRPAASPATSPRGVSVSSLVSSSFFDGGGRVVRWPLSFFPSCYTLSSCSFGWWCCRRPLSPPRPWSPPGWLGRAVPAAGRVLGVCSPSPLPRLTLLFPPSPWPRWR